MSKKSIWTLVIVVVVVVGVIIGIVAASHKSPKPATTASTNSASSYGTKSSTSTSTQSSAVNNAVVVTKTNSSVGSYLADPSGNALYTYSGDNSGVSNCTGSCLATWPAYQDKGSTSGLPTNISTIKRTDNGQIQYTYKGMPLYFFASDSAGQVTGNGVGGFSVAKP